MAKFLNLICAAGLVVSFIGAQAAVAQSCSATAKADFMAGSPPQKERSPVAIKMDPGDTNRCDMKKNTCAAPTVATVTYTAPSCTCQCRTPAQ